MLTFKVQDMTCGHCVSVITQAVMGEDENATIEIDLPAKTVKIKSSKTREDFIKVISESGYTVT